MKKKLLITLVVACTMLFAFGMINVSAAIIGSGSCGHNVTWSLNDEGTLTVSGRGAMEDYNSTYSSYPPWRTKRSSIKKVVISDGVTEIGNDTFEECKNLTDVTIANSVTGIGHRAFYDCDSLISITIPSSVTGIGNTAFYECNNLTSIDVDCNNQFYTSEEGVFFNKAKTKLIQYPAGKNETSYKIPDGVTTIGISAFQHSVNLASIIIADSVATIDTRAFSGCYNLESIIIGVHLKSIADKNFSGCSNLTSIVVDNNNQFFASEEGVLFNKAKTELIQYPAGKNETSYKIPDGVTTIGSSAFYSCGNLTHITISDTVKNIENSAFWICNKLESVIIGNSVTSLGDRAFYHCDNLASIIVPNSLTSIGTSTFAYCKNIEIVNYNGTQNDWNKILIDSGNDNLANATRNYFWYVTYIDEKGKELQKDIVSLNSTATLPEIDGYELKFYTDNEFTSLYNPSAAITQNTTIYVKKIKLPTDKSVISGDTSAKVGTIGLVQTIDITTDKDVVAFVAEFKIPSSLTLMKIVPTGFQYAEEYERKSENGYIIVSVLAQYNDDANIPQKERISAFELHFDIAKTATVGDATIEFTENTYLVGNETYKFEEMIGSIITILPQLAESIEVIGLDNISSPTQYEVSFSPYYTTDKSVTWSVDDETIATISQDGILTPVKNGTVILTAVTNDESGVFASKEILVTAYAKLTDLISNIGEWNREFDTNINEYIIYVDSGTDEIKLTANFLRGTLKINNSLAVKNVAKTVKLTNTITEIVLALSGGTTLEGNNYTVTVVKGDNALSSNVTRTNIGYNFNVLFNRNKIQSFESATLITGLYDEHGKFTGFNKVPITSVDAPLSITVETTETATKAKLMLWKDFKTLIPLCESTEITLE